MLKLIVQHSPKLLAFLCGLQLRLSKPQLQHVLRLADALIVSEVRHKTIAGAYRLIVDAPDPSNGADTLRISPWTAEDLRTPIRHFIVADLLAYAKQSDNWTLYVSLDDSLSAKDKGTRHLEAVEYHHDHTKSQSKTKPYYTNGTVHVEVGVLAKRGQLTRPSFGVLRTFGAPRVLGPLPVAEVPRCLQAQSLALGMYQSLLQS